MSSVRLTYYLRPYLVDYLVHRYGIITEPLPANIRSEGSPLAVYLSCTVVGRHRPDAAKVQEFARTRTPYTIVINHHRANRHGRYITLGGQRVFERLVYHQLIHELAAHINAHKRHGVQTIASIIDFMLANGISLDSIDPEHLKRVFHKTASKHSARTVPAPRTTAPAPSPSP